MADQNELRNYIARYRDIDERIRALNREVQPLREQRSVIALDIAEFMRQPDFVTIDKIDITQDGSSIKIKRPGTWYKPWTLSRNTLKDYLYRYFASRTTYDSRSCIEFITNLHDTKQLQNTFSIERVVKTEE